MAEKRKQGRPTLLTPEKRAAVLDLISSFPVLSLLKISETLGIRYQSIFKLLREEEGFRNDYALARECRADLLFDQMLEISDDDTRDSLQCGDKLIESRVVVDRARLKVDSRKWILARLSPKKYGDRMEMGVYPSGGPSPAEIAWEAIMKKRGIK